MNPKAQSGIDVMLQKTISLLETQAETLQKQLEIKDRQIADMIKQIEELNERLKESYTVIDKYQKQLEDKIGQLADIMEQLNHSPVVYGYFRIITKKQSHDDTFFEEQTNELLSNGASEVISDTYTGNTTEYPELAQLLERLKNGDTLMVTKLEHIAKSFTQVIELINDLIEHGIRVHVLNIGVIDDSQTGQIVRNTIISLAEFERNMIMQRTREGKEIARTKEGYHEGRPKKYEKKQMDHAMQLLQGHSYSQVSKITGISTATLAREKNKRK